MTTTPAPTTASTTAFTTAFTTAAAVVDIDVLAQLVGRDGTTQHHQALVQLATVVDQAGLLPGAVEVLRDAHAPEASRARALLAVGRRWDDIIASQRAAFDRSFAALAAQWVTHQELRRDGTIEQLVHSGTRLDELRQCVRRHAIPAG